MNKIETLDDMYNNRDWKEGVIIFTKDSFMDEYTKEERSYRVLSDNKFFNDNMLGNSLFGSCLDGKDNYVRLDIMMWYCDWKIEEIYITKWNE